MSVLHDVVRAVDSYTRSVDVEVKRARAGDASRKAVLDRWQRAKSRIASVTTPTGITLPRLALPDTDDPGEIARYFHEQGLPGEFPFVNSIYPEMYLDAVDEAGAAPAPGAPTPTNGNGKRRRTTIESGGVTSATTTPAKPAKAEEPMRLFAGLGLAEDTNGRFHFLTKHQTSARLSTAFDGPTLYGLDSDADGGVFGKIGEGGVAIDTVENMVRLYEGFDLTAPASSVSMTINGPAPMILAMFIAAAKRRFGDDCVPKLRGTVQADILKEVQAQNEMLFPIDASLRLLTDMVEYCTKHMPRWYPISISGYHIAEAGATPVQQAAYTLSNGFAYVEMFRERGLDVNEFGPRLSFFLDCGLDVEYLALARVCRKIWAVGMRDVFGANHKAQLFKLHTQTSGRSLIANTFKNNLTRTAVELMMAYMNATNSCHSNSADEPFTTPGEEYVKLAANAQSIILEESGLFKHMMNTLPGSPGMRAVEKAVEEAILNEFRTMDELGGVIAAVEHRYQRSQIQSAAHTYERQIYANERPIIGLNRYAEGNGQPEVHLVRTPRAKKQLQIDRLKKFKKCNAAKSQAALDRLSKVVDSGGNVFAELVETVEVCSLGQITERLHELVGHYRPMV
jgi:methylmalonyl-CoA mutase cobalamin-binding domain/chain